ncbi:tyrosine-type recombinase/integrase [Demequina sp. SO4-18]|uniref:tyrosine-type recombinase/integrase n=1 Tax=Demequina sp. SO4-18 TaxID=3401026 RepID=UPI003B5A02D5
MASWRPRVRKDGSVVYQVLYRLNGRQTSEMHLTQRSAESMVSLIDKVGLERALEVVAERQHSQAVPTLREWGEHHVEHLTGVTSGTLHRYRRSLEVDFPEMIDVPLNLITRDAVSQWVKRLTAEGQSAKTIANKHGLLFSVMRTAMHAEHIDRNPCDGTRLPRTERREMTFLTPAELERLLVNVRPDARDLVRVLAGTGARWGEATAWQAKDWDKSARRITISRAWKYTGTSARESGAVKTLRSRRTLAVADQVADIFDAAVQGLAPSDYIFTTPTGLPWRAHNFHEQVWQPAIHYANGGYPRDDAGNERFNGRARPEWRVPATEPLGKRPRPHDCRHSCASWLIARGVTLPVVQQYLGHESIKTTVDRYGHIEPAHMKAAASALTASMGGGEIVEVVGEIEA